MKKTTETFKKEVYDLVKDEYTVLGNYINNKTNIEIKHNTCGKTYLVPPNRFLSQGNRCPYCYGTFRKTTETFKKEVYDLVKDEYTVLGNYINNKTNIEIKHNTCGTIYKVLPKDFIYNNHRCPYCYNKYGRSRNRKYDQNKFISLLKSKYKDRYEILSEYSTSMEKILVNDTKCSHPAWWARPDALLSGITHCPMCSSGKHNSKGQNEVVEFISSL